MGWVRRLIARLPAGVQRIIVAVKDVTYKALERAALTGIVAFALPVTHLGSLHAWGSAAGAAAAAALVAGWTVVTAAARAALDRYPDGS